MKTGILLTNIGSPDQPTKKSVRTYLKKFLSDKRVVEIPKLIWYPILYGLILPFRAKKSAALYQKIWTDQGSPLTVLSKQLTKKLENKLAIPVALGMHYGNPTITHGLEMLRKQNVNKIWILPLFPQYSATSTASTFDCVSKILNSWRNLPEIHMVRDYADHPAYINAICQSIQNSWKNHGKSQHLLFSFHGIPKQNIERGDPYYDQCQLTVRLVTEKLQLKKCDWSISFQSRLGRAQWLSPYTDKILQELPQREITDLDVICPGFAIDCLETLEEINIRGREQFLNAGGKRFNYIPALNDSDAQISMIQQIIETKTTTML